MIIKNFDELATTELRRQALEIAEAGFEAISMPKLIGENLHIDGDKLVIKDESFDLESFENIYVVGMGKGSAMGAMEIEKSLGSDKITEGHVIDIVKQDLSKINSHIGTHPLPSDQNEVATEYIVKTLQKATEKDLVLAVICGGGSSLACKPGGLTCLELQFISKILMMQGASIQETNTVRKHVSRIHGGHVAQYAYPAKLVSLIFSDVPGDDISVIASGPTVMDPTSKEEAAAVIKKYNLPQLSCIKTPKDSKFFERVTNILLASGKDAVAAMESKAKEIGLKPRVLDTELQGMARDIGPKLAKDVQPGEALLASGETQVVVNHPGKGGRNQDVVLSAVDSLPEGSAIMSLASDGKDNVKVAGAIADSQETRNKLKDLNETAMSYVDKNNSWELLDKLNDHVFIEPVTANVSDFMLCIREKHED